MIIVNNPSQAQSQLQQLPLSSSEKFLLPFTPVCDLTTDITLPYISGTRVVVVDFSYCDIDSICSKPAASL